MWYSVLIIGSIFGGHSAHVSMIMEITGPYNVILLSLIWEKQVWTYTTNTFNKNPPDRQNSPGIYIWNLKSSGRSKNNQRDKNTRQGAQSEKNSSPQCYAVGLVAPGCLSDRFEARQPSSIQSVQQLSSQALIRTGDKGTWEWQKGKVTWWMVPDRRPNWLNWHTKWIFCQRRRIHFTCPSGKAPTDSVWNCVWKLWKVTDESDISTAHWGVGNSKRLPIGARADTSLPRGDQWG